VGTTTRVDELEVNSLARVPGAASVLLSDTGTTLYQELSGKAPLDFNNKVPIENLPFVFTETAGFRGARVSLATAIQLVPGELVRIPWDTEKYNYGGYLELVDGAYRFQVDYPGVYGVSTSVKTINGVSSTRVRLRLVVNKFSNGLTYGVPVLDQAFEPGVDAYHTGSVELVLDPGDSVEVHVGLDGSGYVAGAGVTEVQLHRVLKVPDENTGNVPSNDYEELKAQLDSLRAIVAGLINDSRFVITLVQVEGHLGVLRVSPDEESYGVNQPVDVILEVYEDFYHAEWIKLNDTYYYFNNGQFVSASSLLHSLELKEGPGYGLDADPGTSRVSLTASPLQYTRGEDINVIITPEAGKTVQYVYVNGKVYTPEDYPAPGLPVNMVLLNAIRPKFQLSDSISGMAEYFKFDPDYPEYNLNDEVTITVDLPQGQRLDEIVVGGDRYVMQDSGELLRLENQTFTLDIQSPVSADIVVLNPRADGIYPYGYELKLSVDADDTFESVDINGVTYVPFPGDTSVLVPSDQVRHHMDLDGDYDVQFYPVRVGNMYKAYEDVSILVDIEDGLDHMTIGGIRYVEYPEHSGFVVDPYKTLRTVSIQQPVGFQVNSELEFQVLAVQTVYISYTPNPGYNEFPLVVNGITIYPDPDTNLFEV
jgi:hypothetical protein